ncbi:MAG: DUF11 domain-containing protein, partial [Actinobacteria bacterium]|nr:DUF11 domain-containing protein [Actinomycetota bacterium]
TAVIDLENNSVTMVVTNPGSPFKCDFDNEEEAPQEVETGRIVIEKLVTEGSDQEIEFTFVSVGFSMGDDTLAHGADDSTAVARGDYAVSEVIPEGWELVSAVCDSTDEADESTPADIDVSADEVVTCTFTNGEVEVAEEVLPQIAVTKTADTETAAPGDTVTFTVVISNPSASEPVRISSIIDSVFGTLAGDTDCTVDVTLAPGASCEFTFTWMVTDQDLGTHENIVEVIGADVERPDVTVRASDNVVISVDEVQAIVITPEVPAGPVTPIVPDVAPDVVSDVAVEAEQLPFTGIESDRLIGLAIMLLGGGVLLLRWAPRPEEG